MTQWTFDEPADSADFSDKLEPKNILNHLLLVWAIGYIEHSPTRFTQPGKPSDVILVDCVDLDAADPQTGQPGYLARKCWWRQGKLIQLLRPKIGSRNPIVAWMVKGIASQGAQPPYVLQSATAHPEAVARATAWLQAHPDFEPSKDEPMGRPEAVPAEPTFRAPPPVPAAPATSTVLERLASQAAAGVQRVQGWGPVARDAVPPPPPPPQSQTPPF